MEEERPVRDARKALEEELKKTSLENKPDTTEKSTETMISGPAGAGVQASPITAKEPETAIEKEDESEVVDGTEFAGDNGDSDRGDGRSGLSKSQFRLVIVGVFLIAILIVVGLFLPPISLAERLGLTGNEEPAVSESPGTINNEDIPAEGIEVTLSSDSSQIKIKSIAQGKFLNGEAGDAWLDALERIPGSLTLVSDVYELDLDENDLRGTATLAVPSSAQPHQTLDLYGWNGSVWVFIASEVNGTGAMLTSVATDLPLALALMQTSQAAKLSIGAEVLPAQELPEAVLPIINEVTAGSLTLAENGQLIGEPAAVPSGSYRQLLRATNTGVMVDSVTLNSLLDSPGAQQENIAQLVNRAYGSGYAGINLDYQGVQPGQRSAFTAFVEKLAGALHEDGLDLAITLETPVLLDGKWDTAGQDWVALGKIADEVYVQMPVDPTTYADDGIAQSVIEWATRQVDRGKTFALLSVSAIDAVGDARSEIHNDLIAANFGNLEFVEGTSEVVAGQPVNVSLSGPAGGLVWDSTALTYKYGYELAGQVHEVWLGSEAVLAYQARFINQYHLYGLAIRGLGQLDDGTGYAAAVDSLQGNGEAPSPKSAAIVWAVEDESGGIVASSSSEEPSFSWAGSDVPGIYLVMADFAHGDSIINLGQIEITVNPLVEEEVVAEAEIEETVEEEEEAEAAPTSTPQAGSFDPGNADAVANTPANVRKGPGVVFGIIGGVQAGETVSLIGRNNDKSWYQVVLNDATEGWIYAQLLNVNAAVDTGALAVVEVEAPVASSGPAPAPVIAPAGGGSFELGGQTHTLANPTVMQMAGMNWVKFQHKWGSGDSPSAVAGRIQQSHANGMKVLLSIPGSSTYPGSIDFSGYVEFLRGVAALGPDAIEVWNEENIDFEWPAGQINPTSYVNSMLAPAYNAIKSANPSVMVISGAPAPTGFDNGTNAWADDRYMAGVAAAGGANYMDCIGVHYNAGATSPSATSGHPGGNHYSWYFGPTLNMYYNSFGGARPVCFTELGYLSGGDFGGVPSRFSWAANTTVAQHAQWLAEAASLSANSGRVRLMIVFNVDFTLWGDDPQAGYAMLRPDGSCPSCGLLGQVMGR